MENHEFNDGDYADYLAWGIPVGLLLVRGGSITPAELAMESSSHLVLWGH